MTRVALSTFSLRQLLGPLSVDFPDGQGGSHQVHIPYPPASLKINELPHLIQERMGIGDLELVQFQLDASTDLPKLEAALREAGVGVVNFLIDAGDLDDADPVRRSESVELSRRWIDAAAALGSTFARVNAGSPAKRASRKIPASDELVATLQALGSYAQARGVRLLVENHGGRSSDPTWLLDLLERAGRDHLGLLLDLGNLHPLIEYLAACRAGDTDSADRLDLESLYGVIRELAPHAEAVSVKSYDFDEAGTHTTYDIPRALSVLTEGGFAGPISIEYEGEAGDPWINCRRTLDLIRDTLASLNTP